MQVAPERSGWRDLGLNNRHRKWGFDCPAVDIDFLEYDDRLPVAIVEYKHERAKIDYTSANISALQNLADRANIPFLLCKYTGDYTKWDTIPMNDYAKSMLVKTIFTEIEYVRFLYKMRNRELPNDILYKLKGGIYAG